MDRANIIHDLLNWIENHLDQPLLLDNVAAKSGYSKWHLQRMFRSTTGHALGSYIRERRLSKAAQALRATPRPILDIALQFHFDSQPSFSRAFKKQFGETPAVYRRTPQQDEVALSSEHCYRHGTPSLHSLYKRQCVDEGCTHWVGQR
ncbi:helix-turn-helix domain-containing protein [Serratia fonticola]|uniref:helix-turn-helix domain-containing protein n=1 Tax=Serratia fonticola TaxID=47917 RepID=UPI00301C04BD